MQADAFDYRFDVKLSDTDAAGVMFFAQLLRHAHDAYEAWMARLGRPLDGMIRTGSLALPIVHAQADYRLPLRHGETVIVRVGVARVGPKSFTIDYRFMTADNRPAASASTVHAAVLPATGETTTLPADLAADLTALVRAGEGAG
jgi:1,4-dihydroxy-2-naphthoyl-CoA hydrolase